MLKNSKLIALVLAIFISLTFVACNKKDASVRNLLEDIDNTQRDGKETYTISQDTINKEDSSSYNIELLKKRTDSDIKASISSKEQNIDLDLKNRNGEIQVGIGSLLKYVTSLFAEEGGDVEGLFEGIEVNSYVTLSNVAEDINEQVESLKELPSLIREAYGDYRPLYLTKSKGNYVYKATKEEFKEERTAFKEYIKENREKVDKIYSKYNNEIIKELKEDPDELIEQFKKVQSVDFYGNKKGYNLTIETKEGLIKFDYKFDESTDFELVDFKGKEKTLEDMQELLLPLLLGGMLDNISSED